MRALLAGSHIVYVVDGSYQYAGCRHHVVGSLNLS
jgi:hypothetical protein